MKGLHLFASTLLKNVSVKIETEHLIALLKCQNSVLSTNANIQGYELAVTWVIKKSKSRVCYRIVKCRSFFLKDICKSNFTTITQYHWIFFVTCEIMNPHNLMNLLTCSYSFPEILFINEFVYNHTLYKSFVENAVEFLKNVHSICHQRRYNSFTPFSPFEVLSCKKIFQFPALISCRQRIPKLILPIF